MTRVAAFWQREDLIFCGPQRPSSWRARLEKDTGNCLGDRRGKRATVSAVWLKALAAEAGENSSRVSG